MAFISLRYLRFLDAKPLGRNAKEAALMAEEAIEVYMNIETRVILEREIPIDDV
jgi:hypothetical protein